MKATMLAFWRAARLSAVDQDGSRYMPCSNKSHAHHHGLSDSMRVQYEEVRALFREYLDVPGEPAATSAGGGAVAFPGAGGAGDGSDGASPLPRVAFVTSASTNFLEAGRPRCPAGTTNRSGACRAGTGSTCSACSSSGVSMPWSTSSATTR